MNDDVIYWVAFNKMGIFSVFQLCEIKKELESLKEFWKMEDLESNKLLEKKNLSKVQLRNFIQKRNSIKIKNCGMEVSVAYRNGISIITPDSAKYPSILINSLEKPPIVIYSAGKIEIEERNAIAIIGTRNPSYYGKRKAREIAYDLASSGYTIVSGLARGIDIAAHEGAMEASGKTIAVLANGLLDYPSGIKDLKSLNGDLVVYPKEHSEIAKDIVDSGGALISESPFGSQPKSFRLLARNRIIAAFTIASVAIEGNIRSGTLSEINHASKMGRKIYALQPKDKERSCAKFPLKLINEERGMAITSGQEIITNLGTFGLPKINEDKNYFCLKKTSTLSCH